MNRNQKYIILSYYISIQILVRSEVDIRHLILYYSEIGQILHILSLPNDTVEIL